MKFSFKSKFILVLTIFSIIPSVKASENKRPNKISLFAIGVASGALIGIVACKLHNKYSQKYTRLPAKKKKIIRSFAVNMSTVLPGTFLLYRSYSNLPTFISMFLATAVLLAITAKVVPTANNDVLFDRFFPEALTPGIIEKIVRTKINFDLKVNFIIYSIFYCFAFNNKAVATNSVSDREDRSLVCPQIQVSI